MPHLFLPNGIVLSDKLSNTHSIVMLLPPGKNLKVERIFLWTVFPIKIGNYTTLLPNEKFDLLHCNHCTKWEIIASHNVLCNGQEPNATFGYQSSIYGGITNPPFHVTFVPSRPCSLPSLSRAHLIDGVKMRSQSTKYWNETRTLH